ncbi:MAG: V-type ATP synthase subunit F [Candidatus Diapherotrites archaeon]
MKAAAFGEKNFINGFKLAGINSAVIAKEKDSEVLEQFMELASKKDLGLIILSSGVSGKLKKHLIDFISVNPLPSIVEVPSKGMKGTGLVEELTSKVMGIKKEE